jgi:uncharacterized RDD family membrane protein YckC
VDRAPAQPSALVTPEAVVLQFETASVASRLLAIFIDLAIQVPLLVLANLALALFVSAAGAGGWVGVSLLFGIVFMVLLGYPVGFESLWRGRTPGKAAMGLRVVTREGAPIRFRHAAIRGSLGLIDFWLTSGAAAVISVLVTRDNQRLGDLAAGTLVLRERTGAGTPAAVRFAPPPGYEDYAAALDVGGLSAQQYGAVRSFLLRAGSLPPPARAALATQLAVPLAAAMRHEPPATVSPEAFLVCVAAGYQRRADQAAHRAAPGPHLVPSAWSAAAAPTVPAPRPDPPPAGPEPPSGGFTPPT